MERHACFSSCGCFRITLTRSGLNGFLGNKPERTIIFVMLNPSTANSDEDDPTIRRCISFALDTGHDNLVVVNLFPIISPYPEVLENYAENYGNESLLNNDYWMRVELIQKDVDMVVCAWGGFPVAGNRAAAVLDLIKGAGHTPMCLGITKAGAPRHPLYIKRGTVPVLYQAEGYYG